MREQTCCVTGHRNLPAGQDAMRTALREAVQCAMDNGCTHFISGFAEGADLLFAEVVAEFKQTHPITLEAAIPYPRQRDAQAQRLLACCDKVIVHSDHYHRGCFYIRNRYMVDQSKYDIAVYDGRDTGGTAATVRYAMRQGCLLFTIHP